MLKGHEPRRMAGRKILEEGPERRIDRQDGTETREIARMGKVSLERDGRSRAQSDPVSGCEGK